MRSQVLGQAFRGLVVLSVTLSFLAGAVRAQQAEEAAGGAPDPAVGSSAAQSKTPYFGATPPGETPEPFAPQVLGVLNAWVEATAFSPDGNQFFFSVGAQDYSSAKLYCARRVKGVWRLFEEAPFTADFEYSNEPVFSADGSTLTFTGMKDSGSLDLWTVRRSNGAWGTPAALPSPINGEGNEFRGSTASDGTLYFGSNRSGMMQIYKAYRNAAREMVVEMLDAPVNTQSYEGDPCVAPDGHYLVFYSGRDGRSTDLYVSFADGQGGWMDPIDLGPAFNGAYDEYGAHLSPDGKYLFFTRHTSKGNVILWVSASAIEKLEP